MNNFGGIFAVNMDECQSNSSLKRQLNNEQRPKNEVKRQRLDPAEVKEPAAVQPLKIIDLNDDCLTKIFGYLNLRSLLNVANANEWLRPAAADVYKRKFGTKTVQLSIHDNRPKTRSSVHNDCPVQCAVPKEYKHSIEMNSSLLCFQYIRCFGSSISDLTIDYNESKPKLIEHLHHYINEYCAESLIEIGFRSKPNHSIEQFVKPFVNIENVNVDGGNFGKQLLSFIKWFPRMRYLEFRNVQVNHHFSAIHFQHLEHLTIDDCNQIGLTFYDAKNLLQSNQQLKSIEIKTDLHKIPIGTWLVIIKDHKSLTKLSLMRNEWSFVNSAVVQRLINEHPSLVELNMQNNMFTVNLVITLIERLKSLKMFSFNLYHWDIRELESTLKECHKRWSLNSTNIPRRILQTIFLSAQD